VVKLRGLPFRANEVDVIEFFQGLDVVDVLLVRNGEDGKFNGDAFVVFGAAMQVRCIFS
jgi:heterogeneous nuclear ribonucleoprotein F/H